MAECAYMYTDARYAIDRSNRATVRSQQVCVHSLWKALNQGKYSNWQTDLLLESSGLHQVASAVHNKDALDSG